MLYRSGALEHMTAAEGAWLSQTVGIATVLDLRHPEELEGLAPHPLARQVQQLSLLPQAGSLSGLIGELNGLYGKGATPRRYMHYLSVSGGQLARAFALLARRDAYPI